MQHKEPSTKEEDVANDPGDARDSPTPSEETENVGDGAGTGVGAGTPPANPAKEEKPGPSQCEVPSAELNTRRRADLTKVGHSAFLKCPTDNQ